MKQTLEQIAAVADFLIDQRDEPGPGHAFESDRLHYWRDKAIEAADRLRAILQAQENTNATGG